MVTFLHTADWQLGMTRHFLDEDAQPRFSAARIDAIRTIGQAAEEAGAAFVVVCGDVFETNHVERRVIVRALETMGEAKTTFYLLPGNHDPLDASSVFRSAIFEQNRPDNVIVLDRPGIWETGHGLELVAAPWSSKRPLADLVSQAARELSSDGTIRVAVGHGGADVLSPDPNDPALVRVAELEAAAGDGRLHYVALGDRHSTTEVGATGRIWYSGAPEPTDYRESDPGNVLVVRLDDARSVHVERRRVGTWRFLQEDFELSGAGDVDRVSDWLTGLPNKDRTIVKLALVGSLSLREKAGLDAVIEHHADLFSALETWARRSELVVVPGDGDLSELRVAGFARAAVEALRVDAGGSGEDALVARDALTLLYRLGSSPS